MTGIKLKEKKISKLNYLIKISYKFFLKKMLQTNYKLKFDIAKQPKERL
jgi:hypothetical protein